MFSIDDHDGETVAVDLSTDGWVRLVCGAGRLYGKAGAHLDPLAARALAAALTDAADEAELRALEEAAAGNG